MSSVTSQAIIDAASDDSSDSDFFNKSLSIWRESNPNVELADEPLPLDLHTACSIGNYEAVESYIDRFVSCLYLSINLYVIDQRP